jgi:Tfp pilus assembly protein PilN
MAQDINLLPEQAGPDSQQTKQRKLVGQVSIAILSITILAVIGLFAAKLLLQARVDGLDKNIATQDQRIQAKKTEEGIYRSLDAKLTSLSTFFASQKHYSTFLDQFSKTVPNSMTLTDMSVAADNKATISGKVATYADLAGFYDKLRTASKSASGQPSSASASATVNASAAYFTSPTLVSISRDEQSGQINFSMTFTLTPLVITAGTSS